MEKIWNKKFILLFITNLLMMATFYASVPILPIYCQQIGITGSKIGIVLTAMSLTTVLFFTMGSYFFLETTVHLFAAGFLLGLGYGILQPLFQSFVTGTTPAPKRGAANATYLLSYDIGIGIGSFVMGLFQESIGLSMGFAVTAVAYIAGGTIYVVYVDASYGKLTMHRGESLHKAPASAGKAERGVDDGIFFSAMCHLLRPHQAMCGRVQRKG